MTTKKKHPREIFVLKHEVLDFVAAQPKDRKVNLMDVGMGNGWTGCVFCHYVAEKFGWELKDINAHPTFVTNLKTHEVIHFTQSVFRMFEYDDWYTTYGKLQELNGLNQGENEHDQKQKDST